MEWKLPWQVMREHQLIDVNLSDGQVKRTAVVRHADPLLNPFLTVSISAMAARKILFIDLSFDFVVSSDLPNSNPPLALTCSFTASSTVVRGTYSTSEPAEFGPEGQTHLAVAKVWYSILSCRCVLIFSLSLCACVLFPSPSFTFLANNPCPFPIQPSTHVSIWVSFKHPLCLSNV